MTFFDWHNDSGGARVSSYLWIYVVVTLVFTIITVGAWYFFVVHQKSQRSRSDAEAV